jgi:DNA-binding transcriptional regulator YiaG
MANIGKVFKDEMIRLSRKNALASTKPLKNEIRSLKLQIRSLGMELKTIKAALGKPASAKSAEAGAEAPAKTRAFTGKGVKALRRKLKLTQAELAKLANVSSQAVVMWERKQGKIRLRHATETALSAVRGMSKAEAKAALGK